MKENVFQDAFQLEQLLAYGPTTTVELYFCKSGQDQSSLRQSMVKIVQIEFPR